MAELWKIQIKPNQSNGDSAPLQSLPPPLFCEISLQQLFQVWGWVWLWRDQCWWLEQWYLGQIIKTPFSHKNILCPPIQVSYLVVISPSGDTVFSGVFGDKEGNNAGKGKTLQKKLDNALRPEMKSGYMCFTGEYLTVMRNGDLMINTDSDTVPGAGFLKLTKTY